MIDIQLLKEYESVVQKEVALRISRYILSNGRGHFVTDGAAEDLVKIIETRDWIKEDL